MYTTKGLITSLLAVVLVIGILSTAAAGEDLAERMRLIEASRQLMEAQEAPPRVRVGLLVTNYGTEGEVNLGGKVELLIPQRETASLILEGIYLEEEGALSGLLSLKFSPRLGHTVAPYVGLGGVVTEDADYQLFAGVDIAEYFFLEAKGINEGRNILETDLYLSAGFQMNF